MLIVLCHPSLLGNLYRTNRISTILGSSNKTHCISVAVILHKQGLVKELKLLAECKNVQCVKGATNYCCCRVLYNQLDFIAVELNEIWREHAKQEGFQCFSFQNFIANLISSS